MSHPLLSWCIQLWESPSVNRRSEEWAGPFVIVPFDTTCSVWLKHRGTLRPLILISKRPLPRIFKSMFFDFTKLSPVTSSSSPWLLHLLLFLTLIFVYYSFASAESDW